MINNIFYFLFNSFFHIRWNKHYSIEYKMDVWAYISINGPNAEFRSWSNEAGSKIRVNFREGMIFFIIALFSY